MPIAGVLVPLGATLGALYISKGCAVMYGGAAADKDSLSGGMRACAACTALQMKYALYSRAMVL